MVCRRWRPWKQQIEEGRAVDLEQQREPGREGRKTKDREEMGLMTKKEEKKLNVCGRGKRVSSCCK
jgi:hypothetical protein